MAILIGTILVFALAYETYRSGRRLLSPTPRSNPALARLFNAEDDRLGSEPDSAAEARESDLSRQLFDGRLDPGAYQRAMTDLAQPDASGTGTVR